ncbi:MAG: OsmC family peroxiredoxin [Gemmatimonadetes bacterium]|nr:OsmC family peroxiredoxin [Gemmatimonadota bacterium]
MDRKAEAQWFGDLKSGHGTMSVGSKAFSGPYSFISRFEGSKDTNPEELLGAAHAACFSMALSNTLAQRGTPVTNVTTTAVVTAEKTDAGFAITRIALTTRGVVPGLSAEEFKKVAEETKTGCIVSRALAAVPMTLDAELVG